MRRPVSNLGRSSKRGRKNHSASQTAVSLHYNMYYKNWLPLTRTSKNIFQWYFHIFKVHFSCVWTFDAHLFLWWATEVNMFKIRDGVNKIEVSMISTWNRWNFWEIILNKNCIQLCQFCMVIRFFIPPTTANDLRLRRISIPDVIHYLCISYLRSWETANISYLMLSAKQGNYWYHYIVISMILSLTRKWTRDLLHSKPVLHH